MIDAKNIVHLPLDKHKLVRVHPIQEFPLVVRIILDPISLTLFIWIDECNRCDILVSINAAEVT